MKKKILSGILSVVMLLTIIMVPVTASDNIKVVIDGTEIFFDVPPMTISDRTMVPLRAIFEALGATVNWNEATQTVTSQRDDITVKLTIGVLVMYVNRRAVSLDVPARIINNRTLVPVRAISEAFGADVSWNEDAKIVYISSQKTASSKEQILPAEPISYSGSGDKVITGVNIPAGSYYAEYTHDGDHNFIAHLYYGTDKYDYDLLANEIGVCSGQKIAESTRMAEIINGILEVEADGSWTIDIKPVSGVCTTNFRGCGNTVTEIFTALSAHNVVSYSGFGKHNLIAHVYPLKGKKYDYELAVNDIAPCSGEKLVNLKVGEKYFMTVEADGDWAIDFGNGDPLTDTTDKSNTNDNRYSDDVSDTITKTDYQKVCDYIKAAEDIVKKAQSSTTVPIVASGAKDCLQKAFDILSKYDDIPIDNSKATFTEEVQTAIDTCDKVIDDGVMLALVNKPLLSITISELSIEATLLKAKIK